MTTKVFRGQLLVFTSRPTDDNGNPVTPSSVKLYLNYPHLNGVTSTDEPIDMLMQTGGTWKADFDTADTKPGAAFASLRAANPPGAEDIKFTIVANPANPP